MVHLSLAANACICFSSGKYSSLVTPGAELVQTSRYPGPLESVPETGTVSLAPCALHEVASSTGAASHLHVEWLRYTVH